LNDLEPIPPIANEIEDPSSQKLSGFKQLDLVIAYRALIQAFVQSDEVARTDIEIKKHDDKVYDNS
jgi:hypothetical protein